MNTSQTYIDIIRAHQPELQERFGITSMRMFGSAAIFPDVVKNDLTPPLLY